MKLKTSLLREKFIINELGSDNNAKKLSLTARSNRLALSLTTGENQPENFVIRTSHMHVCVRLSALILQEFMTFGPIMNRKPPLKWDFLWEEKILNAYERLYNDDIWACVYHNGKSVFTTGDHHSFLDVIEKCAALENTVYDQCVTITEDTFKRAGKPVKIFYDSNIALVTGIEPKEARSGMVLRTIERTTTFNFYVTGGEKTPVDAAQILSVSAAFLEGIQLSYFIGYNLEKMRVGLIEPYSEEHTKVKHAQQRLQKLDAEISAFHNKNNVRYRPERPNFNAIVSKTEKAAASSIIMDDDDTYIE